MNTVVIPHKIMLYYLHDAIILYFTLYLGARGASYGCVTVHNIIIRTPTRMYDSFGLRVTSNKHVPSI